MHGTTIVEGELQFLDESCLTFQFLVSFLDQGTYTFSNIIPIIEEWSIDNRITLDRLTNTNFASTVLPEPERFVIVVSSS